MLNEATMDKLREMQLDTIVEVLRNQGNDSAFIALSFDERFGLLIDAEWSARRSRKLTRLIRGAQFHLPNACVEDIEYLPDRKLDQSLISRLATCTYIQEKHNIIILGATGAGKTYLGCASVMMVMMMVRCVAVMMVAVSSEAAAVAASAP